jgi:beta-glucosidase
MIDGQACSENKCLLDIVRNDWRYKGIFMSDWFGTYSTEAPIKAGLDLEMPFPVQRGTKLIAAVEAGVISMQEIDARVLRMLEVRDRTRRSHRYEKESSEIIPATIQVARDLAAGGIILLKNDNDVLPLQGSLRPKVAVIGEFGQMPVVTGGGSASCNPQYVIPPVEAIMKALNGDESSVRYTSGVRTRRIIPMAEKQYLRAENGKPGVDVCYYNDGEPNTPVCKEYIDRATVWMFGRFKEGLKVPGSHLVMTTKLKAPSTGQYTLAVRATGSFTLQIDGEEVLTRGQPDVTPEQTLFNHILLESRVDVQLVGGQTYNAKVTMKSRDRLNTGEPTPYAVTFCMEENYNEADAIQEAADLAKASDTAIIFAGRDGQYESEGFDMKSITMPENQTRLIKAVAAVAKKTVVILHSGNPIDVTAFVDDVDAVVAAHFYGQEGPNALADILTGKVNPSGRLASTWPKSLESTPTFGNFPSTKNEQGKYAIKYEEGLQLGYRHPDSSWVRWPFGHGLSYTKFEYSELKASVAVKGEDDLPQSLVCSVRLANTGAVAGREVVQVYVMPAASATDYSTRFTIRSVWRPKKELKGFTKVLLQPGESKVVTIDMDLKAACSYWSEDESAWCLRPGVYGMVVGQCKGEFEVKEGAIWTHL